MIRFRVTKVNGLNELFDEDMFQEYLDGIVQEYPGTTYVRDETGAEVTMPRSSMRIPEDVQG